MELFGKGTGPEFTNDPEYATSGEYLPELVDEDKIKDLVLMPPEIKERFMRDFGL